MRGVIGGGHVLIDNSSCLFYSTDIFTGGAVGGLGVQPGFTWTAVYDSAGGGAPYFGPNSRFRPPARAIAHALAGRPQHQLPVRPVLRGTGFLAT